MMAAIAMVDIACPVCEASGSREVCVTKDYVYRVPGKFRFVRCDRCRHVFMNPRPAADALMQAYPSDYRPYSPLATDCTAAPGRTPPPRAGRLRRSLRRIPGLRAFLCWLGESNATVVLEPPDRDGCRLLEIGCAYGGYLEQAQQHGWIVSGIEPSETAANVARQRGFHVIIGKLEDVEVPASSQDAVVAWMVLEHVTHPIDFINDCFQILRNGGRIALSVPNSASFERLITGRYWQGYDPPRHLQIFSASELRRLLTTAGFTDVKVIHQSTVRAFYASLGGFGAEHFPHADWPERWLEYFRGEPSRLVHWMSLFPAKLLSLLRCSGRITVVAVKPR